MFNNEADIPTTSHVLVGVYGTLKKGFHRHGSLGFDAVSMGDLPILGVMFHNGDWPQVIQIPEKVEFRKSAQVVCEVYKIRTQQLIVLDGIEGHPSLFQRRTVYDAKYGNVWIYFWADAEGLLKGKRNMITKGRWEGNNTRAMKVDFFDGTTKPKIVLSENHIYNAEVDKFSNTAELDGVVVDVSTGEVVRIDWDNLSLCNPEYAPNPPHYTKRYWHKTRHSYFNERGEELEWCYTAENYVLKGTKKPTAYLPPPPLKPKEPDAPSIVKVTKIAKLESPFPKIVEL